MDVRLTKRQKRSEQELSEQKSCTSSSEDGVSEPSTVPLSLSKSKLNVSRSFLTYSNANAEKAFSDSSYHSSLFKLQTDELLKKLKPHYKSRMASAETALRMLRDTIDNIPERKNLTISEAERIFEKSSIVRIPFPRSTAESGSNFMLAYSKPAKVDVIGSFARKTALLLNGKVTIDLGLTMPSHLFQAKDYRDYRYFQKRAYYLACLADGIQKANIPSLDLSFAYQDDNPLQPILMVDPFQDAPGREPFQSQYRIRILLAASGDLFPLDKTLPAKACLRHSTLKGEDNHPSPMYNAILRSECCSLLSCELFSQSDACRDVFMLGAVWLRQRGFSSSIAEGGFGQFEWASVVSMLTRGGGQAGRPILSSGYSSYQLFKVTLQYLANTDLTSSPALFQSTNVQLVNTGRPVFFDGVRGLNLLFKMSPWSYQLLRKEASTSLGALNDPLVTHFYSTGPVKADGPRIPFDMHDDLEPGSTSVCDRASDLAAKVYERFSYGLGDRATLIYPQMPCRPSWELTSPPCLLRSILYMTVGLFLRPENSRRTVDRGPPIENRQSSAFFREFWGAKAELRRFKDGTILESLIWDESGLDQGPLDKIIKYILNRHFDDHESSGAELSGEIFNNLVPQRRSTHSDILWPFSLARSAFESLCKSIRALDLPLHVRQLSAASPQLRFSSLHAPESSLPYSLKSPIEFHIQFEGSTRWPQDLVAIQRTKLAFLLKIAEGLDRDDSVLAASLGLSDAKHQLPEEPSLDIITVDGITFRLRVHHEHELAILEQALYSQVHLAVSREEIAVAVSDWKREFIQSPTHTQALYTLSIQFPVLSLTIRLFKRWRDAHLLSPHIQDELIELLAMRTFVHPYPWQPPGSLTSAFVRTLAFVANWDWHTDPLIVDLNSELAKQDVEAINVRFQAWRKLDPGISRVAMFAASNVDRDGTTWTDRRPAKMVASRFTNLARAASDLVRDRGLDIEPEALFTPSLAGYDFLIHLKRGYSTGSQRRSSYKNLQTKSSEDLFEGILDHSQRFFDELQDLYGDNVILFCNKSAPTVIAGLWKPQTGPRNWKVGLDYSTVPKSESEVTINKASTLHDIARLGGDMITRIDQIS
ncbi:MAG: hypothetical protein Q9170_002540 [Blastenia crenularia]